MVYYWELANFQGWFPVLINAMFIFKKVGRGEKCYQSFIFIFIMYIHFEYYFVFVQNGHLIIT